VAVLARNISGHSPMESAVARAYNGGLGAEPPAEHSPWSGAQGGKALPEAKALLVFVRSMKAANLPTYLKFANVNKSDICVIFTKADGWPQNWGKGLEQNWGPVPPVWA